MGGHHKSIVHQLLEEARVGAGGGPGWQPSRTHDTHTCQPAQHVVVGKGVEGYQGGVGL